MSNPEYFVCNCSDLSISAYFIRTLTHFISLFGERTLSQLGGHLWDCLRAMQAFIQVRQKIITSLASVVLLPVFNRCCFMRWFTQVWHFEISLLPSSYAGHQMQPTSKSGGVGLLCHFQRLALSAPIDWRKFSMDEIMNPCHVVHLTGYRSKSTISPNFTTEDVPRLFARQEYARFRLECAERCGSKIFEFNQLMVWQSLFYYWGFVIF